MIKRIDRNHDPLISDHQRNWIAVWSEGDDITNFVQQEIIFCLVLDL